MVRLRFSVYPVNTCCPCCPSDAHRLGLLRPATPDHCGTGNRTPSGRGRRQGVACADARKGGGDGKLERIAAGGAIRKSREPEGTRNQMRKKVRQPGK